MTHSMLREPICKASITRLIRTSPFNTVQSIGQACKMGSRFPLAMHFNLTDSPFEILWSGLTEILEYIKVLVIKN